MPARFPQLAPADITPTRRQRPRAARLSRPVLRLHALPMIDLIATATALAFALYG